MSMRWTEEMHFAWKQREAARAAAAAPVPTLVTESTIVLPWPPSGNHGTRHANGAHYLTREHKDYRAHVMALVKGKGIVPVLGRLSVTVRFAVPDRRRRDLDNAWKVLSDALVHAGMIGDDGDIDELHLYRLPVVKGGAAHVTVAAL